MSVRAPCELEPRLPYLPLVLGTCVFGHRAFDLGCVMERAEHGG